LAARSPAGAFPLAPAVADGGNGYVDFSGEGANALRVATSAMPGTRTLWVKRVRNPSAAVPHRLRAWERSWRQAAAVGGGTDAVEEGDDQGGVEVLGGVGRDQVEGVGAGREPVGVEVGLTGGATAG
jgi:hypothetical protein